MSVRVRILADQDPECAFCKLDGEPVGGIGYFVAGLAYGIHDRDIPICKTHVPMFRTGCEVAGSVWDTEATH